MPLACACRPSSTSTSPADERIEDPEWLRLAGERGWVVFMKDQQIRYREVERAAVLDSQVRGFCLSSGNLRSPEMAGHFLARLVEITAACADWAGALRGGQVDDSPA